MTVTETEWLALNDPWAMLKVVEPLKPSERKVRLFNAAMCRRFWDYLPDESKDILSQSERIADGLVQAGPDKWHLCHLANAVVAPFDRKYPDKKFPSREISIKRNVAAAVCYAVIPNDLWGSGAYIRDFEPAEKLTHANIIRDVFRTLFRDIVFDARWRALNDGTLVKLAEAVYNERAFHDLPLLANALEEAGCSDSDLLGHCRQPGGHVRGCWVVDLILGKN
jgi:hypothetical protein